MIVWRIVECLSLGYQVFIETDIIIMHHLPNDGNLLLLGLQDNQTAPVLAPCPATHLSHHHEAMLIGTEVRIVQHGVGINDAYHGDVVEVQAL